MNAGPTPVTSEESMVTPPSPAATLGAMAVAKMATAEPSVTVPKYACIEAVQLTLIQLVLRRFSASAVIAFP